ncbi:MAG TPA: hypothetical protein VEI73_02085 [Candidatus Acidoferrum sp.]|nr:hypothetical protein [Candidatus Acidoferrum sp.]
MNQMATYLRRAADGSITQDDFYEYFRRWKTANPGALTEVIFEEVEHFWAAANERKFLGFRLGAPKNIQESNKQRLRILATALEEGWDGERARNEIDQY